MVNSKLSLEGKPWNILPTPYVGRRYFLVNSRPVASSWCSSHLSVCGLQHQGVHFLLLFFFFCALLHQQVNEDKIYGRTDIHKTTTTKFHPCWHYTEGIWFAWSVDQHSWTGKIKLCHDVFIWTCFMLCELEKMAAKNTPSFVWFGRLSL